MPTAGTPEHVDHVLQRGTMARLREALYAAACMLLAARQVPTFTNLNNVAIVTRVSAAKNGIAGIHYRGADGEEVQVTDLSFLRATTIHAAAQAEGIVSLCVTATTSRERCWPWAASRPSALKKRTSRRCPTGRW